MTEGRQTLKTRNPKCETDEPPATRRKRVGMLIRNQLATFAPVRFSFGRGFK
jgi:hypothetical protein